MNKKSLYTVFLVAFISMSTLAGMVTTTQASDSTFIYKLIYKSDVSGSCLVFSGIGLDVDWWVEGVGYINMLGEGLGKGPIPFALPASDPSLYPIDKKTGTPIFPLAYLSDVGNVSGIGTLFVEWTYNSEEHTWILYLQPDPAEVGPLPFGGVFYTDFDIYWIPIHYEGFTENGAISGEGLIASSGTNPEFEQAGIPSGTSMIAVILFVGDTQLWFAWFNKSINLELLNPLFIGEMSPVAAVFVTYVKEETTSFSPYVYFGGIGTVLTAVIAGVVITRRRINSKRNIL